MARPDTARGIVIGLGIGITVGVSALLLARAGGPAARALLRSGSIFIAKGRELTAELAEVAEDFVAEVRAAWDEGEGTLAADEDDFSAAGNVQQLRDS